MPEPRGDTLTKHNRYRRNSTTKAMLRDAKYRAKKAGLPFNLELSDIQIPERCPVFGKVLFVQGGVATDWSPSLDRIVPEMGYTKGNIIVVSRRVNTIKQNATIEELRMIADFYRKNIKTLMR